MMELLHRLTAVWGPTGREQKVVELLQELIAPHVDEVTADRYGNLIAARRGGSGGKRLMLSAHMDTMGAMAMNFTEKGLILLSPVGDLKVFHAIGQRVVWGSGMVGVLQHHSVEEVKELDFKNLYCEVGATTREEAQENVRLGEICTLVGELQQMGDLVVGPSLDNRAGCAVLLKVAEHLTDTDHHLVFAFTSQSKAGPRGAAVAAYGAEPEIALAVELTSAGDMPGAPRSEVRLGGGPAIRLKDAGHMAHFGLVGALRQVAEEFSIPLQTEILSNASTQSDAKVIGVSRQGVPAATLAIPARYRGTGAEAINLRDLHGTTDLLLKLLGGPVQL